MQKDCGESGAEDCQEVQQVIFKKINLRPFQYYPRKTNEVYFHFFRRFKKIKTLIKQIWHTKKIHLGVDLSATDMTNLLLKSAISTLTKKGPDKNLSPWFFDRCILSHFGTGNFF